MPLLKNLSLGGIMLPFRILYNCVLLTITMVLLVTGQGMAAPAWQDVPQELLLQPDSWRNEQFIYVSGAAQITALAGRHGKAQELARKKSLSRALTVLRLSVSCQPLIEQLPANARQQFSTIFAPLTPELRVEGLTVLRQWQQGDEMFTLASVPLAKLPESSCPYPNLEQALAAYSQFEKASTEGLAFCLGHTAPYGKLNKDLEARLSTHLFGAPPAVAQLLRQNRFQQASKLANKSAKLLATEPAAALELIKKALTLAPFHAQANLQLARFYRINSKQPGLARLAARRGMADGTALPAGLEEMLQILQATKSTEAEVWEYVKQQTGTTSLPEEWQAEAELLQQASTIALVIRSSGQAIFGNNQPPAPPFHKAVSLYQQSSNNDDLLKVLALLIESAQQQPLAAETWNLIGTCYRNLDRPFMALPFLWQALNLRAGYDLALTNLALCLQKLELQESSAYYLQHKAVQTSDNPWIISIREKQVQP